MPIQQNVITLNSLTATLVSVPKSEQPNYERNVALSIQNLDMSTSIFVGNADVTSEFFGYQILPQSDISIDISPSDELYAISENGTLQVAILSIGE